MSQFIVSYTRMAFNPQENKKMKFKSYLFKNQWAFFPLPFAYFYLETCDPESHVPFLKNKICGIYLSFNWLKYTFNVGCHKSFE